MKEECQPLISMIVPVYNVEMYLNHCVDSIIDQTYSNIEIILVDDGSPDNCPLLCDQYSEKDSRVKVIHKENGGLSSARNIGIKHAKGDYVSFVDSDDYIMPDMVEQLVLIIKETNSKIAICKLSIDKKELTKGITNNYLELTTKEALKEIFLDGLFDTSACAKLFDKKLFDQILFPEGKLYEDYGTIYKLISRTSKVAFVNSKKYYYAYNETSITNSPFSKKQMDYFDASDDIERYIRNSYPDLLKYVTNRSTNMAISLYLRASMLEKNDSFSGEKRRLVSIIRENITSFMLSKYPVRKKFSAIAIAKMPIIAEMLLKKYSQIFIK